MSCVISESIVSYVEACSFVCVEPPSEFDRALSTLIKEEDTVTVAGEKYQHLLDGLPQQLELEKRVDRLRNVVSCCCWGGGCLMTAGILTANPFGYLAVPLGACVIASGCRIKLNGYGRHSKVLEKTRALAPITRDPTPITPGG